MFTPRILSALFIVAATLMQIACQSASAQNKVSAGPLVVREQLNQTYGPEILEYAFSGNGDAAALRVTGPKGPAPAQLTQGKLYLLIDELKPLTSANYTVAFDKGAAPVTTDLKVTKADNAVEITTANVGIKLRLGSDKPAKPIAFKEVPGFLIASRFGQGAWAGSSAFTGDALVSEWSSTLEASGPVIARVVFNCSFADGNKLTLSAAVVAGDNTVRWQMHTPQDKPELGITLNLTPVPGAKTATLPKGYGQWARADKTANVTPGPAPFVNLSPDSSVVAFFPDSPWCIRIGEGATQMELTSRDMGSWVEVVEPFTYGGFKHWDLNMIPKSWDNWKRKRIPVIYGADGTITLTPNLAKGGRKWIVSGGGAPKVGDEFNNIKDMVLDWPTDSKRPYPRVFVDQADIQAARTRAAADPALQAALQRQAYVIASSAIKLLALPPAERPKAEVDALVAELRKKLATMGNYDVMRWAIADVCLYDAMIDSDLLTPQDKALFKAQMAYLGYLLANPRTWNIERGFHSGNPNMSLSYTLSLGVLACALSDHPMAKTWSDYASGMMDATLNNEVGANGEWLPEGSHYGYVSLEPMVSYAVAAKRAGFRDFTNDERLKRCLIYFAKTHTPVDPSRKDQRRSGAFGRGTSGDNFSVFGTAAKMTQKSDPAFSALMAWIFATSGSKTASNDFRLGGYEDYYADRTLPQTAPTWSTDFFPQLGTIHRAAFNTPNESYLNFLGATDGERNLDIWTPGIGGISQWFGRGKPLSTCFNFKTGYAERHEFLRDGVRLARNWGQPNDAKVPFGYYVKTNLATAAILPGSDYVRSNFVHQKVDDRDWFPDNLPAFPVVTPAKEPKLDWTRQLLFMKDADANGPSYIVLRDTTKGGQPTAWQFWTLSEKIGTPEQAASANFLADKPGPTNKPASELPAGTRYTAVGQFGVNVEYFIASPANTPRHTLRMGGPDNSRVPEWEDLLHLQLPGDGVYFVAIFPRPTAEAAPTFTTLADGTVIKVAGAFGTDLAFLSEAEASANAEGASFKGTSGSVQQRAASTALTLGAAGEVKWKDLALKGTLAASITAGKDSLTLSIPAGSPAGEITVTAPGYKISGNGATEVSANTYSFKLPASKEAQTISFKKK